MEDSCYPSSVYLDGGQGRQLRTETRCYGRSGDSQVKEGVAYAAGIDREAARAWVTEGNCPDGPGREFGDCIAERGVVVQERAGETVVVAVAFDVAVTTPNGRQELTLVVRVVG